MHKMLGIIADFDIIPSMKTHDDFNKISKNELISLLQEKNSLLEKQVAQQAKQIHFLEEQALAYQLRQFAAKSEKMPLNQISLFDEASAPKSEEKNLAQEEEITVASYQRKSNVGRKGWLFANSVDGANAAATCKNCM